MLAVARLVAHGPGHDAEKLRSRNHGSSLHERHLPVGEKLARVSSLWNIMPWLSMLACLPYRVRIPCKARTTHSCSGSGSCVHRSGLNCFISWMSYHGSYGDGNVPCGFVLVAVHTLKRTAWPLIICMPFIISTVRKPKRCVRIPTVCFVRQRC